MIDFKTEAMAGEAGGRTRKVKEMTRTDGSNGVGRKTNGGMNGNVDYYAIRNDERFRRAKAAQVGQPGVE
jgi:hypothetical protein